MKEYLRQIANERGSYLPFVIFVSLIIFSTVTTMIAVYKNETVIGYQLWEHMKAETIVEMTKRKFVAEDLMEAEETGEVHYVFPSGNAFVSYEKTAPNEYFLRLKIQTDRDEVIFIDTVIFI